MPATLQNVIDRVRSNLEETSATFWTDQELINWINDGLRDVARRSESLHTVKSSETVAADASLITPTVTDIIRINRIEFVDGGGQTYPLQAATYGELDQYWGLQPSSSSGYPYYYAIIGYPGGTGTSALKIKLWPASASGGTLTLYYWKLPARLTTSDTAVNISIVEGWDDLPVLYAEWNAKRKDRNPEWMQVKGVYEEKLGELIEVTRSYHDQQQFITTGTSMVPSWLWEGND